jgi:mono/diheme cytochrome c family protein
MVLRAAVAALLLTTPALANDGAAAWKRCSACHLADGKGVPGAFPRLAGRLHDAAETDAGRAYLILTVTAGVMGPIDVDGKTIRGFMPAQAGLTNADVAAVLNYAASLPGPDGKTVAAIKPFTADEVAAVKAAHPGVNPNAVHAARTGVPFESGGSTP